MIASGTRRFFGFHSDGMAHPYLTRPRVAAGGATVMSSAPSWTQSVTGRVPRVGLTYALTAYLATVVARAHEVVPFLSQVSPAKLSLLFVLLFLATNPRQ